VWRQTLKATRPTLVRFRQLSHGNAAHRIHASFTPFLQERIVWSRTLRGRFFNLLGYILSVYGVYRVVMAMVNIVLKRDPTKDPVTMLFEVRGMGRLRVCYRVCCRTACL
jgi:hypothetical protein